MVISDPHSEVIGLIAGDGQLPTEVIQYCTLHSKPLFVIAFEGQHTALPLKGVHHAVFHLGSIGKIMSTLRKAGVSRLILAGKIARPRFSSLKMDLQAMKLVKRITASHFMGDNHIFTTIVAFLEENGFTVSGVQDVLPSILTPSGLLTKKKPDKRMVDDISIASDILQAMGNLDVGQAAIIQHGLVLGVEAIEGTDALISRCADLKKSPTGGVLVKCKKPSQDVRIDLPTIGLNTVENVYQAGFRGIAIQANASLIVQRDEVIKRANQLKMVIMGIE
jgi:DUF1009 family protein